MGETEDAEMFVKRKSMVKTVAVNQGETGAIGKTESGGVILGRKGIGRDFRRGRCPDIPAPDQIKLRLCW